MKKLLFILFLFLTIVVKSQTELLPTVAWRTYVSNVEQLTDSTYKFDVMPLDWNEPGASLMQYGNYFADYAGNIYEVSDSAYLSVTVTDVFERGVSPQVGRIGVMYQSPDSSLYLAPIVYRYLDEGALDNIRAIELAFLSKKDLSLVDSLAVHRNLIDNLTNDSLTFRQNGNSFGTKAIIGTNDNQSFGIETNGTERVTVTNTGVGIGTINPSGRLDVRDGDIYFQGTGTRNVYINRSGGTTALISSSVTGTGLTFGTTTNSPISIITNNLTRIRLIESGNVGIATTAPTEKLHVVGNILADTAKTDLHVPTYGQVKKLANYTEQQFTGNQTLTLSATPLTNDMLFFLNGIAITTYSRTGTAVTYTGSLALDSNDKILIKFR